MLRTRTFVALAIAASFVFGSTGFGDPPTPLPNAEFAAPPPATGSQGTDAGSPTPLAPLVLPPPTAEQIPTEVVPSNPRVGGDGVLDAELIRRGGVAFEQNCTQCHDAAKSLEKAKPFREWMSTIQRMAEKSDASIPTDSFEPIAAYLASKHPVPANDQAGAGPAAWLMPIPGVTFNGTVSPTWRGGNDFLQNSGFFPDVWIGVNVNNGSPLTAHATACISCHDDGGTGNRIELVDAALRLDLLRALGMEHPAIRNSVEAGRFIVPFGAFAAQSNPGVYRTVSRPLMYNMGQRVRDGDLGDPVLPMPYSDEGAVYSLGLPVTQRTRLNLDGYVVNGLQGTAGGVDFDLSRAYNASNTTPSVGGRATFGNDVFRLGTSAIGGTFSPTGGAGPGNTKMGYHIFGVDAQYRYRDLFRFQAEYARRNSDHLRGDPAMPTNAPDVVDGFYAESEVLLFDYLRTSFLTRYDWQRHAAPTAAAAGEPFTAFDVHRFTTGFNFTLRGGSLLMLNYEYWLLPTGFDNLSVYGVRWAATF
ncbi:MAG: hypothetical protein K8U03_11515 [Planctomycetia bacterium]|nr:hypothetical protein [Planctomycetia bacterium]